MNYYPVLRWKTGEQTALQELDTETKNNIIPILEFPMFGEARPQRDQNLEDAQNALNRKMERKINEFSTKLSSCWGNSEIFLDLNSLLSQNQVHVSINNLNQIFINANLNIVPIIHPTQDAELLNFLENLLSENIIQTIGFRVDLNSNPNDRHIINQNVNRLHLDISNISIIMDLQDVSTNSINQNLRNIRSLYNDFQNTYDRVIVLSGALGNQISMMDSNSRNEVSRIDWRTWQSAINDPLLSNIQFGDYTTDSALFADLPFQGAPKIKYTLEDHWIIYKGHRPRGSQDRNAIQFRQMSNNLVQSTEWRTPTCYGERQILACANGTVEIGSPTTWVGIGINQHITFVVSQMNAIHPAP